ncbi:MAG: hypothetical protein KAR42_16885 [candidate division Zixibacteria bacterium]|nr:hypothetical protein [candidate division Zixibacteria bacterium]
MPPKIPWEIIGPAAGIVIILLALIFKFMLKWQKQAKDKTIQNFPAPPSNLNTVSKKTLCFAHEGKIASNQTAIEMIGEQLKTSNKNNLDAHEKMFDKIDELKTDIIKEIHISNGD